MLLDARHDHSHQNGLVARIALAIVCLGLVSGGTPVAMPTLPRFAPTLALMAARALRACSIEHATHAPSVVAVVAPRESSLDAALIARVREMHPDVLVVLGARVRNGRPGRHLIQRVATAFALFHALDERPSLLLTGGHGEALAMRDMLLERGVPAEKLLLETRAGSTVQNAEFATALLCHSAHRVRSVLLVTTAVLRHGLVVDDHAQRALNDFARLRRPFRIAALSVNAEPWIAPRMYTGYQRVARTHSRWRAAR